MSCEHNTAIQQSLFDKIMQMTINEFAHHIGRHFNDEDERLVYELCSRNDFFKGEGEFTFNKTVDDLANHLCHGSLDCPPDHDNDTKELNTLLNLVTKLVDYQFDNLPDYQ
tara:strand:- start:192 stop:524 length:333 start_codon:yes stop_codon:yes gene_type:complete